MKASPCRNNIEILEYLSDIGMLYLEEPISSKEFSVIIEDTLYTVHVSNTELKIRGERLYV